ncbi:MAG: methyltransferase domain-containing protein [Candidatus Electrothrix sp. AR3]|nr:methyltransferase domain-containing protein [Candidatus Electrothrix sp. AR3]
MMTELTTKDKLIKHYQKDALVYDLNRRFFLFGRKALISLIGKTLKPATILEIGCGTGGNLLRLSKLFPKAKLTGIDLSADMLDVAKNKLGDNISLIHEMFDHNLVLAKFDLIVCSYLTSTVPELPKLLAQVAETLNDNGHFACVDFHSSNNEAFKRWISHSIPIRTHFPVAALSPLFEETVLSSKRAYLGIWRYFMYIGQKR